MRSQDGKKKAPKLNLDPFDNLRGRPRVFLLRPQEEDPGGGLGGVGRAPGVRGRCLDCGGGGAMGLCRAVTVGVPMCLVSF